MVNEDGIIPFALRDENLKGVVYTTRPLREPETYRMRVRALSYSIDGAIEYQTTFIVYIAVSAYPYQERTADSNQSMLTTCIHAAGCHHFQNDCCLILKQLQTLQLRGKNGAIFVSSLWLPIKCYLSILTKKKGHNRWFLRILTTCFIYYTGAVTYQRLF